MTRALPEWIAKHDDQAIPPRVRLRIWMRSFGHCINCTRAMRAGEAPQFDHIIALVNGGQHRESNLQLLCFTCHAVKTKTDVAEKSAVYTKRLKHTGIKRRPSFAGWRGFDGRPIRNPKLRRRA